MAALVLLAVAALVGLALRRRALTRTPGSFDCSARSGGGRWSPGVARFGRHSVQWWQVYSLSPRSVETWSRDDLALLGRRWPAPGEVGALQPAALVLRCTHRGDGLDLAMSADAATGFTSWLEAAPPGPHSSVT